MNQYRTHRCGELSEREIGQTVCLAGWLHSCRDHGKLLFIDLRDHAGIVQCVINPNIPAFAVAKDTRVESVVTVTGEVIARGPDWVNKDLPTGKVEVVVKTFEVLSAAEVLPFQVFPENETSEELRLRYRFLDLRRERLHNNIVLRSKVIASLRWRMQEQGFQEFQTPI